jgi:hypothetical protein
MAILSPSIAFERASTIARFVADDACSTRVIAIIDSNNNSTNAISESAMTKANPP